MYICRWSELEGGYFYSSVLFGDSLARRGHGVAIAGMIHGLS